MARLWPKLACQKGVELRLRHGGRSRVIAENHAEHSPAVLEGGIVEAVRSARQHGKADPAGRLRGGERLAIGGRRHGVGAADHDQGRYPELRPVLVGARRIERGRGAEGEAGRRRRSSRRDRERGVAALRGAEDGDACSVDVRPRRQPRQRAIGVGYPLREIDRAGLPKPARREVVDRKRRIAGSDERRSIAALFEGRPRQVWRRTTAGNGPAPLGLCEPPLQGRPPVAEKETRSSPRARRLKGRKRQGLPREQRCRAAGNNSIHRKRRSNNNHSARYFARAPKFIKGLGVFFCNFRRTSNFYAFDFPVADRPRVRRRVCRWRRTKLF